MNLKELLKNLDYEILNGEVDIEVGEIQYDSRKVKIGDIFVCISGFTVDGHEFAEKAVSSGAAVLLVEKPIKNYNNVTVIKVGDTRKALAKISAEFYNNPQDNLKIIGITGTNGKTTSAFMLKSILEHCGYKVGLIGTIANYIGDKKLKTERTTPESLELFKLFYDMVKENVDYCVMEVSSHSLALDRVYGINFTTGIFTNLTQDHLDFHKTFENYFNAKAKLFETSKTSVINIDDEYGTKLFEIAKKPLTFSGDKDADLKLKDMSLFSRGVTFKVQYKNEIQDITINIPGKYNVYNALGCIGACLLQGMNLKEIKEGLQSLMAVPGRCEIVTYGKELGFDIVVDYAHTPDGLENILKTAKEFTQGRLITVFGCGGDRDKTKRPLMGRIASKLSDIIIVTSDNPRTEEPMSIIEDILKGIENNDYFVEKDRKEAIKMAINKAEKKDVIVIAGKGHEDYQVLKDKTIHFDEREVINEIIKELF